MLIKIETPAIRIFRILLFYLHFFLDLSFLFPSDIFIFHTSLLEHSLELASLNFTGWQIVISLIEMTTKLNWLSELNPGGPVGRSGLQIAYQLILSTVQLF